MDSIAEQNRHNIDAYLNENYLPFVFVARLVFTLPASKIGITILYPKAYFI